MSGGRTQTLIVGGGQAGLALSRLLTFTGREHVVVERGRIGERWHSERWDSLALLTPTWMNRLPGAPDLGDADGFASGRAFAASLKDYAASFGAPVLDGTSVERVRAHARGLEIATDRGAWGAENVVVATGHCDTPLVPAVSASAPAGIVQVHASGYRSPEQLPPGGVIVVGAGASGQQIALELRAAGRPVTIAVGRHSRMPRRYRGRDAFGWLQALGHLDRTIDEVPHPDAARRSPSLPLDGRGGGRQLDLEVLARQGVVLAGRLAGFEDGRALFAGDLAGAVSTAEQRLAAMLDRVDAIADAAGAEPGDRLPPVPVANAPRSLELSGTSAIVWATGYRRSYPWLELDVLDGEGELIHRRGVTPVPGLYALGLRWQHRMTSHQIGGVGQDAAYLSSHIAARAARAA